MEEKYEQLIQERLKSFYNIINLRFTKAEVEKIMSAYEFAAEAHKNQRRRTGEPYIIHPIAVAQIIAQVLELDVAPIIAGFLHDVVEDTDYTIKDVEERFGSDVAFLVGVVTKQKKSTYVQSQQVDNFRQILSSVNYDIRALLIKLADRLHNMSTLESMLPEKQMKIAGETDYFYAPLANRLGLYHIKTELENLSFRFRCPIEFAGLERQINEFREREKESMDRLVNKISKILGDRGIDVRIEIMYRKPSSVWRKMYSKRCDFEHIDGKRYLRVIYAKPVDMSEKQVSLLIYSILTDYFKECPGSVSNYIDEPKENGYQSFHVKLLNEAGKWEEIHISSERMVRNSRLGCAAERTEQNVKLWIEKFKSVLQTVAENNDCIDFMDGVVLSFYNDDIYVFTRSGQSIILPKGATALDFAFEIDNNLGLHAKCARINGKLMSIKTVLHRGDRVDILHDENVYPERDWINNVLTFNAKNSLRIYLSTLPHLAYKRCPCCHPLPGDEVIGFKGEKGDITLHKRNCKAAISLASKHGDSILAVNFEENEDILYPIRICVRGIDRCHLLNDIVYCITEKQDLSMNKLNIENIDRIVTCTIDFSVHSIHELQAAMASIKQIEGIDEVYRVEREC